MKQLYLIAFFGLLLITNSAWAQSPTWQCCNNRAAYAQLVVDGIKDACEYEALNTTHQSNIETMMLDAAQSFISDSAKYVAPSCKENGPAHANPGGCSCINNAAPIKTPTKEIAVSGCISIQKGHELVQKLVQEYANKCGKNVTVTIILPEIPPPPPPAPPVIQITQPVTCMACGACKPRIEVTPVPAPAPKPPALKEPPPSPPPQIESNPAGGASASSVLRPGIQHSVVVSAPVVFEGSGLSLGAGLRVSPFRAAWAYDLPQDPVEQRRLLDGIHSANGSFALHVLNNIVRSASASLSAVEHGSPFGSIMAPASTVGPLVTSALAWDFFNQRDPLLSSNALDCLRRNVNCQLRGQALGFGVSTLWNNRSSLDLNAAQAYVNWDWQFAKRHSIIGLVGWRFVRTEDLQPLEVGVRYGFGVADATISVESSFRFGTAAAERQLQPSLSGTIPIGWVLVDLGFQVQAPIFQRDDRTAARLLLGLGWNGTHTGDKIAQIARALMQSIPSKTTP